MAMITREELIAEGCVINDQVAQVKALGLSPSEELQEIYYRLYCKRSAEYEMQCFKEQGIPIIEGLPEGGELPEYIIHENLMSTIPFERKTLLTRSKVLKCLAQARTYGMNYLVHIRWLKEGTEHLEQFMRFDKDYIKLYLDARTNDDQEEPVIVETIKLYTSTPEKIDKWVNTFFINAPTR